MHDVHFAETPIKPVEEGAASTIIDDSMGALGINMDMKTDLDISQDIIMEMKLDGFNTSYTPMKRFLSDVVSKPQQLEPMLKNIRQGLIAKHPAILEFAKKSLIEGWFSESLYVQKSIHVAFILEAMTAAMSNSDIFFNEVIAHIRTKERDIGIDSTHLFRTIWRNWPRKGSFSGNFFATAKAVSLDPAMGYFKLRRQQGNGVVVKDTVKNLYRNGELSYFEYKLLLSVCNEGSCYCSDWLRINIYEAGITEYNNRLKSNAISAHALSEEAKKNCHREVYKTGSVLPEGDIDKFYDLLVEEDNRFPTFAFHKDWVSLYESWNMAFILGELNNLHYLFPKLLIPSVINAKPENFLGVRIISLWLSINNTLFLNYENVETIVGPSNRNEMAQAWGEINKKYAFKLSKNNMAEDSNVLKDSFKSRFSRPFFSLFKLIVRFLF